MVESKVFGLCLSNHGPQNVASSAMYERRRWRSSLTHAHHACVNARSLLHRPTAVATHTEAWGHRSNGRHHQPHNHTRDEPPTAAAAAHGACSCGPCCCC
jgi:hypothetical protein